MAEAQYAHNHVINPETGFLENPAFSNDFDSDKKQAFLKVFFDNGLRIRRTCDELGISVDTVNRHYQRDSLFHKLYDEVKERYLDELEGVSRQNALNPKSVIERIFQLKCLIPEKYGQENKPMNTNITLNIDGELLKQVVQRSQIIEAQIITGTQKETLDIQRLESAKKTDNS